MGFYDSNIPSYSETYTPERSSFDVGAGASTAAPTPLAVPLGPPPAQPSTFQRVMNGAIAGASGQGPSAADVGRALALKISPPAAQPPPPGPPLMIPIAPVEPVMHTGGAYVPPPRHDDGGDGGGGGGMLSGIMGGIMGGG